MTRLAAAMLTAMLSCGAAASTGAQPQPRTPVLTCTNPYSGATWQISIDLDHATVDSYPAEVSDSNISWHDSKAGGTYTLDRKTGALTYVAASSTGGYFLHDHCQPPP